MKRITAALLLLTLATTAATASPHYDTVTSKYHRTQKTLPIFRGRIQGLRVADAVTLAKAGIIPAVTDAVDVGMAASGGYTTVITDGTAHRVPNVITQADADVIEAARVQAAIDAANADHEAEAPQGNLASWSKREKCLLLVTYKLAKQHWPTMTKAQFLANVRAEWDAVK